MTGTLFIISAPSGAGKTSLVSQLVEGCDDLIVAVSHTTRPRRPGEVEGEHYHFTDAATFEAEVANGDFLEHACVFGNHYGTAREQVLPRLEAGIDVILEIDWQGAQQVRAALPQSVSIFILPPSRSELERRLRGRGQDSDEVIRGRMDQAVAEMSHCQEYDYLVFNDRFEQALAELKAIVLTRRLRLSAQIERHKSVLAELMS